MAHMAHHSNISLITNHTALRGMSHRYLHSRMFLRILEMVLPAQRAMFKTIILWRGWQWLADSHKACLLEI